MPKTRRNKSLSIYLTIYTNFLEIIRSACHTTFSEGSRLRMFLSLQKTLLDYLFLFLALFLLLLLVPFLLLLLFLRGNRTDHKTYLIRLMTLCIFLHPHDAVDTVFPETGMVCVHALWNYKIVLSVVRYTRSSLPLYISEYCATCEIRSARCNEGESLGTSFTRFLKKHE